MSSKRAGRSVVVVQPPMPTDRPVYSPTTAGNSKNFSRQLFGRTAPSVGGNKSNNAEPSSLSSSSSSHLERLVRFYAYYAPNMVPTASLTLRSYEGREEDLFRALAKKYGPESSVVLKDMGAVTPQQQQSSVTTKSSTVAPVAAIDPPAPPPRIAPMHLDGFKARLERFYRYYAPEKISNVETALAGYKGREEVMFRVLEKKYGPEPRAFVVISPSQKQTASPRSRGNEDDDDDDDDDANVFTTDPNIVGNAAGPDPKNLPLHVPYKYGAVLQALGVRSEAIPVLLAQYGEDKEPYAASVAILMTLIGPEALFDADADRTLSFPLAALQAAKRSTPDLLDQIAFEHILSYRSLFLSAVQHSMYIRGLEAIARQDIVQQALTSTNDIAYRCMVVAEAIRSVEPLEIERRAMVLHDERIRFDGLVLWFRQRRIEILRGVLLIGEGGGATEDDYEAIEADLKKLAAQMLHAPNPDVQFQQLASSPPHTSSSQRVRLSDIEEKMKKVNETIRSRSANLFDNWSRNPPPSSLRHVSPVSIQRATSPGGVAKEVRSHHQSSLLIVPTVERSRSQDERSRSSSTTKQGTTTGVKQQSSVARFSGNTRTVSSSVSSVPGPTNGASAGRSLNLRCPSKSAVPAVEEDNTLEKERKSSSVVVREHLHYDPFRSPSTSSSSHHHHHLPDKPAPAAFSSRTGSSLSTTTTIITASLNSNISAVPCEVDRNVRLHRLMPKGSFSGMRFCSAHQAAAKISELVPARALSADLSKLINDSSAAIDR